MDYFRIKKTYKKIVESKSGLFYFFSAVIVVSAIVLLWTGGVEAHVLHNYRIMFVRDNGSEILGTLISVTFLLTSFLSFLSSHDNLVLWTDAMEYKLMSPKYFNFRSMAIYAFVVMFADIICFFLKKDVLVVVFFVLGIIILIALTFSMINIYFYRSRIISELYRDFYRADNDEQDEMLMNLSLNMNIAIKNNDLRHISENIAFLLNVYMLYSDLEQDVIYCIYDRTHKEKICDYFLKKYKEHIHIVKVFSKIADVKAQQKGEEFPTKKEVREGNYSFYENSLGVIKYFANSNQSKEISEFLDICIHDIGGKTYAIRAELLHIIRQISAEDVFDITSVLTSDTYDIISFDKTWDIIVNSIKGSDLSSVETEIIYQKVFDSYIRHKYETCKKQLLEANHLISKIDSLNLGSSNKKTNIIIGVELIIIQVERGIITLDQFIRAFHSFSCELKKRGEYSSQEINTLIKCTFNSEFSYVNELKNEIEGILKKVPSLSITAKDDYEWIKQRTMESESIIDKDYSIRDGWLFE